MKPFLTAEWRKLILLTYSVDASILEEYLPKGLELDVYNERHFVSLVAFDFLHTRVLGWQVPFHTNFPEINLRFYVRKGEQRGVVFIREYVPRYMIAKIARYRYNEPYQVAEMASSTEISTDKIIVSHEITANNTTHSLCFYAENKPFVPAIDSTEHFFKEHEWGFGTNHRGEVMRYRVEHPVWAIYPLRERFDFQWDFSTLYGKKWEFLNNQIPYNIMLAEGSPVKIFQGEVVANL